MSDVKELAGLGYKDPIKFCKIFLPRLFPGKIPWIHRGIWAVLTRRADFLDEYGEVDKIIKNFVYRREDGTYQSIFRRNDEGILEIALGQYTLLKLGRGFSKTTIAGVAHNLYDILYQTHPYMMYVSESEKHAEMQLNSIKFELETNDRIKSVFGDLKPSPSSSLKWNENFFETTSGIAMIARGRGSQIRGQNHKGNRPKKVTVDDVEDRESVKTEEQRIKTRTWAYAELTPALDDMDSSATLNALGTLLHPEALLQTWEADPLFTVINFGARDRDGDWIWPEKMDEKKYEAKKASFARAGELHTFYMEYDNETRVPEGMKFKPEYFRHEPPGDKELITAIYCDPAISDKKKADDAVIVVAGMASRGEIYVLDVWGKRGATPREIIDEFFRLHKQHKCRYAGVEGNQYQAALVHIMREEMFRKKHYFEVEKVINHRDKATRVEGILQARYASRYIRHARVFQKLETQLLDWNPPGGHDDYPDALAGCVVLLDPTAGQAGEHDPAEDEYEPLVGTSGGAP